MASSILIVGIDSNDIEFLIKLLSKYNNNNDSIDSIIISTKYYNANVTINRYVIDDNNNDISSLKEKCEAMIVLLNDKDNNSNSDLLSIVKCDNDDDDDLIATKLLVNIKYNDICNDISSLVLWSVDNGYEYIDIDSNDSSSISIISDSREKEGFPRLIEALEATMWSSLQMKDKVITTTSSITSEILISEQTSTIKEEQIVSSEEKTNREYKIHMDSNNKLILEVEDDIDEEDVFYKNFSDVIEKAKDIRAQVLSGNLSDKERRDNAAAIALQLAKMIDLNDDDDDDDDDDDK